MSVSLWKLETRFRNGWYYLLGAMLRLYLKIHGCNVGKKLRCEGWPQFGTVPRRNITFGNRVCIGKRVRFDVYGEGRIEVADRVTFRQDVVISILLSISIGEMSSFAEGVSIRDADHLHTIEEEIMPRYHLAEPIAIGRYVGLGPGVVVTRGSIIPDGVIIGPHCVITKGSQLVTNGMYFGTPPILIGKRRPAEALLNAKNLQPLLIDRVKLAR